MRVRFFFETSEHALLLPGFSHRFGNYLCLFLVNLSEFCNSCMFNFCVCSGILLEQPADK